MQIETERLVLRKPSLEDAADLAVAYADPEVVRYLGDGSTSTPAQVEERVAHWLERWEANGLGIFSIVLREEGRVIGDAGFRVWDSETWEAARLADEGTRIEIELGWTVARDHWGLGYATEAACALRDWGIAEPGFTRLISIIQHANARSVRVAEKIGERYERDIVPWGQPRMLYALGGQAPAR